jgi:hypothetical protein
MRLERQFDVDQSAKAASCIASRDDTLRGLFPDSSTEIVERTDTLRTTRTHYTVLGGAERWNIFEAKTYKFKRLS